MCAGQAVRGGRSPYRPWAWPGFLTSVTCSCTTDCARSRAMHITQEGDLLTLINVFETTPEQQQALFEQWIRFTEEVKKEPGYLATALHRSKDGTRVINYAHWRSQAD